ncbi:hypothetical protein V8C86DRAFT_2796566 [Haematococcus lacustris]
MPACQGRAPMGVGWGGACGAWAMAVLREGCGRGWDMELGKLALGCLLPAGPVREELGCLVRLAAIQPTEELDTCTASCARLLWLLLCDSVRYRPCWLSRWTVGRCPSSMPACPTREWLRLTWRLPWRLLEGLPPPSCKNLRLGKRCRRERLPLFSRVVSLPEMRCSGSADTVTPVSGVKYSTPSSSPSPSASPVARVCHRLILVIAYSQTGLAIPEAVPLLHSLTLG